MAADGLDGRCKLCASKLKKEYRLANYDLMLKKESESRKRNKESHKIACRRWEKNNKDKCREYSKKTYFKYHQKYLKKMVEWRSNNIELVNKISKKWRKNNPEKFKALKKKYELSRIKRFPNWADNNKIQIYYWMAQKLTKIFGIQYHVDHIIPLHGKLVTGLHHEKNLQILTQKENNNKYNKFIPCHIDH